MSDGSFISQHDDACGTHAVVVIGGHPPDRRVLGVLPADHTVICADSGLDHALRLGLEPEVVIGDMDSVDRSSLLGARIGGCLVVEHPRDKDLTDTELALQFAADRRFGSITLLWGGGDRIDHVLGVIAALGHPRLAHVERIGAWVASDRIDIVHSGRDMVIDHALDSTVSLLAIGSGDAIVSTTGLKWDLDAETLAADRARGLSNVVVATPARIECRRGVTAVVSPDHLASFERPTVP